MSTNEEMALACDFWHYPNTLDNITSVCPDSLHSMDACIKGIIPKLREHKLENIVFGYHGDYITCDMELNEAPFDLHGKGKTESESFCAALSKLVEEK